VHALRKQPFVLWLALAGLLYRALIPAGFMPGNSAQAQAGAVMVMCPGGMLMPAGDMAPGQPQAHAYSQCPFAEAAGPVLPPALPVLPPAPAPATPLPARQTPASPLRFTRVRPPARAPPLYS
jgi:hypothetical protein